MVDYPQVNKSGTVRLFLRSFLSGEKCALCAEHTTEGTDIICPECREKLDRETGWICGRCGAEIRDCICVPPRMRRAGIDAFIKLFPYFSDDVLTSNRIIYRLKTKKDPLLARRITAELVNSTQMLVKASGADESSTVVTYIPRSRSRFRENGTDQSKSLAIALSGQCGYDCIPLFERNGGDTLQKTLSSSERSMNASGNFSLREDSDVKDACVILVDDLVTTGSTVGGCAGLLKRSGAKAVFCVALAHTVGADADYFRL